MKIQDVKSFTDQLAKDMKEQLESVTLDNQDGLMRVSKSLTIVKQVLQRLKCYIHAYTFKTKAEEIEFFKQIKPIFLSQYYYNQRLLIIKCNEPIGNKEGLLTFYHRELENIQDFIKENIDFHVYCLSGAIHLDEYYFVRQQNTTEPFIDERFTTHYDNILAQMVANESVKDYLLNTIGKLNRDENLALSWTGSKTALIELLYALQSAEIFNNGKADLKQIASTFESLFNISLGNYYRVFQEIRLRKSGRTNFLDQLKEKFIHRMEELD